MADRPNVLLLMCDQLNARILRCYGGPVPTPNIERVLHRGVRFTNAACPTPVCSPSRASMLTGRYPGSHGIAHNCMQKDYPRGTGPSPKTEEGITNADRTTERILNESGYSTHFYGKWHLSGEELSYFPDMYREHQEYYDEMTDEMAQVRQRPRDQWVDWYGWAQPVQVSEYLKNAAAERWQGRAYADFIAKMGRLLWTDEKCFDFKSASRALQTVTSASRPFMVTCSFNNPHDPNVIQDPYYSAFDPEKIELPETFSHWEPRFADEHSRQMVRDLGEPFVREFLRIYYGQVLFVDKQVGRILDALEESGQGDNTIVVFTADHGDMAGGHGMVWKSTTSLYEDVVRVPLIVSHPGLTADAGVCSWEVNLTDLMPTLLELTSHAVPEGVQGQSFADAVFGRQEAPEYFQFNLSERIVPNAEHIRAYSDKPQGGFMLQTPTHKYVQYTDGEEFLYDREHDPGEIASCAADCPDEVQQLRHQLQEAQRRYHGWKP